MVSEASESTQPGSQDEQGDQSNDHQRQPTVGNSFDGVGPQCLASELFGHGYRTGLPVFGDQTRCAITARPLHPPNPLDSRVNSRVYPYK